MSTGRWPVLLLVFLELLGPGQLSADPFIVLQSTTSTQNSGLFELLLPSFKSSAGIEIRVVAVGTGQALKNAANCDGDLVIVHSETDERAFVEKGYGIERVEFMYNDYILVGPDSDPAGIRGSKSAKEAFARISDSTMPFVSRGDGSGTHKKEIAIWQALDREPLGSWYRETGSGMGATLNISVGMGAYALSDRATWLSFRNKNQLAILFEGDRQLFNQYSVIAVNPAHCQKTKSNETRIFIEWLTSEVGQALIAEHLVDGKQLFFPNAAIDQPLAELADPD